MLRHLIRLALRPVPAGRMGGLIARLASHWCATRPPREAMRFLLDVDARLYPLQGGMAVKMGEGLHPKHRLMGYHDFFVARIGADETVLDIGCGVGAVARDIAERTGARVTGIDMSDANIAVARRGSPRDHLEFLTGEAPQALPGRHFDVVVLSNVLEHIEHRVAFLRHVRRENTPRRWLIRVPLFERDWRVPLKRELGVEWRLDPTHFTEYTLESFAAEMREAGLRPVHLEVRWGEIWSELVSGD